MGKSTRNTTTSEFSGFAAFASHTSSASTALTRHVQDQQQQQQRKEEGKEKKTQKSSNSKSKSNVINCNSNKLKPNPIYTGSDSQLIQIFKRIGQKRDSTTKTRALAELISYAYPPIVPSKNAKDSTNVLPNTLRKADQIVALSHYFFLFSNKLIHDNNSSVRSEAIKVLGCAIDHVPKAFKTLLLQQYQQHDDNNFQIGSDNSSTQTGSIGNVSGWVYTSIYSQIMEISRIAKQVWVQIANLLNVQQTAQKDAANSSLILTSSSQIIQYQVCKHVESILQHSSRATNLADALSVVGSTNTSNTNNSFASSSANSSHSKKGKGNKNKHKLITPPSSIQSTTINESDREEMEERYERVILLTLTGMSQFLASYPEEGGKEGKESGVGFYYETQFQNNATVLWKHLSNTRSNFRRASYTLLGSICQNASSIIHPSISLKCASDDEKVQRGGRGHNLSTLIIKSLSAEKDPSNIPSLFELILLYIASFRKYGEKKSAWETGTSEISSTSSTQARTCCIGINIKEFIKSLTKVLRRACHGSASAQWGPSMLPLIVSLPRREFQLQTLAALWSGGMTSALNKVDVAYIVSAVSECSTYLLLQSNDNNDEKEQSKIGNESNSSEVDEDENEIEIQLSMEIAQAFLESLSYFYTLIPSSGTATNKAEEHLKMTLVKDVYKLDMLGSTKSNCYFAPIRQWFWQEGMTKVCMMGKRFNKNDDNVDDQDHLSLEMLQRLDQFVHNIINEISSSKNKMNFDSNGVVESNLYAVFQLIFWAKLQPKESEIPIAEEVSLMVSIIRFCGLGRIFADKNGAMSTQAITHFCASAPMNWILYHMTPNNIDGDDGQSKNELTPLFTLFRMLLPALERRQLLWESLLTEIMNAGCDLKKLSIGLKILLLNMDPESCKELVCGVLDLISIQAATRLLKHCRAKLMNDDDSRSEVEEPTMEFEFLTVCGGIEPGISINLISMSAVITMIQLCETEECQLPYEHTNPLVGILVSICSNSSCSVNEENIVKLLISAWKEGSRSWNMKEVEKLMKPNTHTYANFIYEASSILKSDICQQFRKNEDVELASLIWSERAWRLIEVIKFSHEKSEKICNLLGIDNSSIWISAINCKRNEMSDFLYKSFERLLEKYPHIEQRNKLISQLEADDDSPSILVLILITLAKDNNIESSYSTLDRCNQISKILGNLGNEFYFKGLVSKMATTIQDFMTAKADGNEIKLGIKVLDWVLGINMKKIGVAKNAGATDDVVASEVKVGDELWYIVDSSKQDSERVKVIIDTIHTDDYPNLYFTIKVGDILKQTIPSRLKYNHLPSMESQNECIPWVEEIIASRLIKPYFDDEQRHNNEAAAECLNILISRCGLSESSGIGSNRYDMFQLLTKLGQNTIEQIRQDDFSSLPSNLKRLSIALGYGVHTSSSKNNMEIMRYSCGDLMSTLVDFHGSEKGELLMQENLASSLHPSIVMWLTVATNQTLNESNASEIWTLASAIVSMAAKKDFYKNHESWLCMIMKLYQSMKGASIRLPDEYNAVTMDAEQLIMSNLIKIFVQCEIENDGTEISLPKSPWIGDFESFALESMKNQSLAALSYGTRQQIEGLCECLLSPSKQWCAFQMLSKTSKRDYELYKREDNLLPSTCSRLDKWLKGCEVEDASEIEEDVVTAGMWLPRYLMKELEEFGEKEYDEISDEEEGLTGKFLQWLICLEFLDAAAYTDMRNRTHIGSYMKLTGSIKFIVEAALKFATLEKRQLMDWFNCLSIDYDSHNISLTQLSTLVLFRTVETVPTLFKYWWNDDCPRSMQNLVNKFVEAMVAPETLRRELDKIRGAANLDELSVSGSCVSREVTATYIQDECKLSVLIRVPPTFPLRNVEVDCRKTLGIPENRWRHWALQIMLMLNSQDGGILDALMLWKQNVDKEFDGVEPCPICYSVLCVKSHAMPNLECNTCHNRFHSTCLYKWFSSSGKNQCPLCQQPWSGTKVGSKVGKLKSLSRQAS